MFNLDDITNENNKQHLKKWPYVPDHLHKTLIIGVSGSGKTKVLLTLISQQDDIDKIYLYSKDLSEPKYEFLIKKRENVGIKHLNDSNALMSVQWMTFTRILMITTQAEKENFNCV